MVDFAGWEMPVQYSSIVAEHRATREKATLFDISHMGRFRLDGEQAADFLDRVLTRRVKDLEPGKIRYALVTNDEGGVLDDVLVYHLVDSREQPFYWLVVNAGNRETIANWLEHHRSPANEVSISDQTTRTAMIAIQGPYALRTAQPLFPFPVADLDYYTGRVTMLLGDEVTMSRTGYTGEDGVEIIMPAESAREVWASLLAAGRDIGVIPAGLGARDTLRLEAAMPLYGHELSEQINPFQAGLGFAVNLRGRTFPGCVALARQRENQYQPRRVGLALAGKRVARQHCQIKSGTRPVGEVTSGTFSPTLNRPIAMGYVAAEYSQTGCPLTLDIRGHETAARVVPLPFYKRS